MAKLTAYWRERSRKLRKSKRRYEEKPEPCPFDADAGKVDIDGLDRFITAPRVRISA